LLPIKAFPEMFIGCNLSFLLNISLSPFYLYLSFSQIALQLYISEPHLRIRTHIFLPSGKKLLVAHSRVSLWCQPSMTGECDWNGSIRSTPPSQLGLLETSIENTLHFSIFFSTVLLTLTSLQELLPRATPINHLHENWPQVNF
jgi:hypothetical protein